VKTSDAIQLFLQQTVNVGGLPFRPTAMLPNAETMAAMRDTQRGENLTSHDGFDGMMEDLDE
jgi:DNA-damage-inducible protein J